jgi:Phage Mu protein F like protein
VADDIDLFKTAPDEVVRYFRAKHSRPTFDWRDIAPEEHAFSWTVAKSAGYDILDDIRAAVDAAIVNRERFEDFAARLTPILQEKGWWGKRKQFDPQDGVEKTVQLGSPRRLRTIYWANVRSAHAAGEWERTQRNKRFLPFLVYTLSKALHRREEHEGWVGTVLPVDHEWWHTHYPPNGWGCKCGARQISAGEARRLGYIEGQKAPEVVMRKWTNKRTGETVLVPEGIDPGWQTNPGENRGRNLSELVFGKVEEMPEHRRAVAIGDIVGSPILKTLAERRMPPGAFLPVAQLPAAIADAMGAQTRTVRLSASGVEHMLHDHPARGLTTEDYRDGIAAILNPKAAIANGRAVAIYGLVKGKWWRTVVKSAQEGLEWWMVSLHRKGEKDALRQIAKGEREGRRLK